MPSDPSKPPPLAQSRGAAFLTLSGLASAFGVASCCALPILLTSAGFGTAWLAGIAESASPYRSTLLAVSAISLIGGAFLLWKMQLAARICGPDKACASPVLRLSLLVGLVCGAVLLWLGYSYV